MFAVKWYICHFYCPVGISCWSRNLPHCWVWSSEVPGCPVAGSWKTLGWQTSRWTPSSPLCYHNQSSCELREDVEKWQVLVQPAVLREEQGGKEIMCTHWDQWRKCRGLWRAAASTCQWHFLPATAQNLQILHIPAWTSVGTRTWLFNTWHILYFERGQWSDIQFITVN